MLGFCLPAPLDRSLTWNFFCTEDNTFSISTIMELRICPKVFVCYRSSSSRPKKVRSAWTSPSFGRTSVVRKDSEEEASEMKESGTVLVRSNFWDIRYTSWHTRAPSDDRIIRLSLGPWIATSSIYPSINVSWNRQTLRIIIWKAWVSCTNALLIFSAWLPSLRVFQTVYFSVRTLLSVK